MLVDDLDLIALEHGDVHELAERLAAVLDHEQAGRDDLDHEAERRQLRASCPTRARSPLRPFAPHAEMDAGPLHRRRKLRERGRRERQRCSKREREPAWSGGRNASEIFGVNPSSRRRLAQNAASMIAAIASVGGAGRRCPPRLRAAVMWRAK